VRDDERHDPIDGALSLKRTCATMNDTIAVSFAGTVAVEAMP
jgi:hypothetical protein